MPNYWLLKLTYQFNHLRETKLILFNELLVLILTHEIGSDLSDLFLLLLLHLSPSFFLNIWNTPINPLI